MVEPHKSKSGSQAQSLFAYSDYLELMAILVFMLMVGTIAFFIREVVGGTVDKHSLVLLIDCIDLAIGVNLFWQIDMLKHKKM